MVSNLADDGGAARGELTPPPWTESGVLGRGHPGEMAYIENIGMGRAVTSRAGNSFIPKLFPACPSWERDPSLRLAAACWAVASWRVLGGPMTQGHRGSRCC